MLHVNPVSYGALVREVREQRNLSQVEAASELNVSLRTIQNWETQDSTPWPRHRRAILAWLNGQEAA